MKKTNNIEFLDLYLDKSSVSDWSDTFGGKKDIAFKNIKAGLGRKPDLRKVERDDLSNTIIYKDRMEYWLVRYHLAIRDDENGGYKQVRWVSLDVTYSDSSVKIVETFPKQEFVKVAGVQWSSGAGLDASGKFDLLELMDMPELEELSGVKAKANAHLKGSLSSRFSQSYYKKNIETDGIGQVNGFWRFHRADEPLLGDVGMHHIIEVPKGFFIDNQVSIEAHLEVELSTVANRWITQNREKGPILLELGKVNS